MPFFKGFFYKSEAVFLVFKCSINYYSLDWIIFFLNNILAGSRAHGQSPFQAWSMLNEKKQRNKSVCLFSALRRRTVNPKRVYRNHTGKELPQITERRSRRRKVLTDFPKAHRPGSPPRLPLDVSSSTSRLSRTLEKASGSLKQESLHLWLDMWAWSDFSE